MRNTACTILIMGNRGWVQKYEKTGITWMQRNRSGTLRVISAEQLLSHILPLLIPGNKSPFTLKVERRETS